jgi:hypothetical protein
MIAQFAVRLICGMSLTWLLMPREQVTNGFFRIQSLVTLGLAVLAAVTLGSRPSVAEGAAWLSWHTVVALAVLIAVTSYLSSMLWMLGRRRPGEIALRIVAGLGIVLLLGSMDAGRGGGALLSAFSELSAAWLLGGTLTAMLLGHWYLTATGMPLEPLARLNQFVAAAAVLRVILAGTGLLTLPDHDFSSLEQIWMFLRWSAGCVGPLVMTGLVSRILRFRNTQSATGVLFAAVILAFIGETTASLLTRVLHWPV